MIKQISSLQNPFIKELILYKEKSRARKKAGLFLIEGMREINLALKGGYSITTFLFNPKIISEERILKLANDKIDIIEVTSEIYQRLAYRESTQGVIALAKAKNFSLESVMLKTDSPLILVAEAPEKPGNIGALLRTADAANVDLFIIANPKTDLFNPNIVRSSVGCVFTNEIATGSTTEIIAFLKLNKINIYCAELQASVEYQTVDYKNSAAVVVGTESTGLSDEWLEQSTQNIIIPMSGQIDSLNVSVAAGILIFEAKRQRKSNS
jgi:TrmH family RNA methyltransferase